MGLPYMPISWGGARGVNVAIYGSPMECMGIVFSVGNPLGSRMPCPSSAVCRAGQSPSQARGATGPRSVPREPGFRCPNEQAPRIGGFRHTPPVGIDGFLTGLGSPTMLARSPVR